MIEAWIAVCLGLMILPGPDMALVTRYALRGQGWLAVIGIYISFLLYSILLLGGFLVLLQKWPDWVQVARILGGLYLVYLSVSGLRASWQEAAITEQPKQETSPVVAGFWSNLLNAKQYLFLFLLLPGFLPVNPHWSDTLLLLFILLLVSLVFWMIWIALISRIAAWNKSYIIERISLVALGAVGILLLLGIV